MKLDHKSIQNQDSSVSEDNSSSSEDDENAELLTDELEDRFFKVLSQLKKKGSKLYDESERFFPSNSIEGTTHGSDAGKTKKKLRKEYKEWLKGQKAQVGNEEVKKELEALHNFWTSPSLNKEEQYLRDYILNKKFLEPDDNFNLEEEMKKLSDEEKEIEEELLFEHKYNCRFENSDQDLPGLIKSKPKNKKNKGNDSLNNGISNEIEQVKSKEEESLVKKSNKKKKKKRSSENHTFEESEGINEIVKIESISKNKHNKPGEKVSEQENCNISPCAVSPGNVPGKRSEEETLKNKNKKEKKISAKNPTVEEVGDKKEGSLESLPESKDQVKDTNKNGLQLDTHNNAGKREGKKLKRKRRKSVINTEENCTQNKSNKETIQSESLQPKSKKKRKRFNIENNSTVKAKQFQHSLPRNLQMKNAMGKKKMRHRNRKEVQNTITSDNTKVSTSHDVENMEHKQKERKETSFRGNKKFVGDTKKFKSKKVKHFQNLIVKEKKNKHKKLRKIHSKKHKAANIVVRG